ncbi:MAG: ABC transporter permease [Thermoleophilaceae bacterium]
MSAGGRLPLSLAVPAIATAALVTLPLAYLVVRALGGGPEAWAVLARPGTAAVLGRTILLVASVALVATAVGVAMAFLVTRTDLPGRRWWTVAAALPLVVPSYVAALALIAAFGPGSPLAGAVDSLPGVEGAPDVFGYPGALLALTASTYPYVFLLTAAALRRVDPAVEEAARSLGRSAFDTFRSVTLPLVRPSVLAGALLAALYTLSDFGVVSLMRHDVLTRVIFTQYRTLFDRTPAAVLGLVLVALTVLILVLEARARGGARPAGPPSGRPATIHALGRWRLPALAFCAVVVGLGLVAPVVVLVGWAAFGGARVDGAALLEPAVTSLGLGLGAAVLAVLAALPLALLAVRSPRGLTRALERVAYTGNALPGVVVALGLVFFAVRYAVPLYQTVPLLVFAYLVRFLPQALGGAHSALLSVGSRLEEAARGLGRGPAGAFAAVSLPLLLPGLAASAALVFLSTVKELPATLLLRPTGLDTLATEVWTETSTAAYAEAAIPALALIVLCAPVILALLGAPERRLEPGRPGAAPARRLVEQA